MAARSSVSFMEMVMRGQELHQKPLSVFTLPVLRSFCDVFSVAPHYVTMGQLSCTNELLQGNSCSSAKCAHFPGVCFNVAVFLLRGCAVLSRTHNTWTYSTLYENIYIITLEPLGCVPGIACRL